MRTIMSPDFEPAEVHLQARILLYGRDATLLLTRRLALEKIGFQVWTATLLAEVRNIFATSRSSFFGIDISSARIRDRIGIQILPTSIEAV